MLFRSSEFGAKRTGTSCDVGARGGGKAANGRAREHTEGEVGEVRQVEEDGRSRVASKKLAKSPERRWLRVKASAARQWGSYR